MAAVEKLEHFNRKVSQWLEWVGFAGILTIIFVTTLDVVGAKVFLKPIFGALDVVILAQLIAASFTVSATLLAGRHVRVDFFIESLSKRWRTAVDTFVYSLAFVFFVIIVWRLAMYAYSLQTGGELLQALRFVESGQIKPAVSQVFPLSETARAQTLMETAAEVGKLVLVPGS
jgi:TRAP-type C4-dicarboxylate transport system permease small subunit